MRRFRLIALMILAGPGGALAGTGPAAPDLVAVDACTDGHAGAETSPVVCVDEAPGLIARVAPLRRSLPHGMAAAAARSFGRVPWSAGMIAAAGPGVLAGGPVKLALAGRRAIAGSRPSKG